MIIKAKLIPLLTGIAATVLFTEPAAANTPKFQPLAAPTNAAHVPAGTYRANNGNFVAFNGGQGWRSHRHDFAEGSVTYQYRLGAIGYGTLGFDRGWKATGYVYQASWVSADGKRNGTVWFVFAYNYDLRCWQFHSISRTNGDRSGSLYTDKGSEIR